MSIAGFPLLSYQLLLRTAERVYRPASSKVREATPFSSVVPTSVSAPPSLEARMVAPLTGDAAAAFIPAVPMRVTETGSPVLAVRLSPAK